MKAYALFLGCITPNRYPGIEAATKLVFNKLGIKLTDSKGASCCPAPGVIGSFDVKTWLTVGARNLALAEEMGLDIVTVCSGCFGTLFEVNQTLKENRKLREEVNKILARVDRQYRGNISVHHFIKVIYDLGLNRIKDTVKRPLKGLKVAVHYGCHLLRPSKEKQIDNPEEPKILDELVEALGAKSVNYAEKTMCCGAGGGVRAAFPKLALDITREKLRNVKAVNADCIVTPCSFCHLQFDRGQVEIEKIFKEKYELPVIHYAQLLGLAMGLAPEKLGLYAQKISVKPVLDKIGNNY